MEKTNLRATKRHLSYEITQCLPATRQQETRQENGLRLNPNLADRYSIYLPRRD